MAKKQEEKAETYSDRNVIVRVPKEQAHLFGAFEIDEELTNREKAVKIREHFGIVLVRKKSVSKLRVKLIEQLETAKVKDSSGNTNYNDWTMYKLKSVYVQSQLDV